MHQRRHAGDGPCLFALGAGRELGQRIAATLGIALQAHEERDFEDGEHKLRPLESVRGRDCYVLCSLHGDAQRSPDDKLLRLLFFIATLREGSAARINAVVPYLCFARKDRRTQPHDPVTLRYVAQLFEAVGIDRLITIDVHNLAACQNAFRCPVEHLEAAPLFVEHLAAVVGDTAVAVVSPDSGGAKRAHRFRAHLEHRLGRQIGSAFLDKTRALGKVSGDAVVGQIGNGVAIIVDDLVSTGTTLARAAAACRASGASRVYAATTHGLFTGDAAQVISAAALTKLLVTDTVAPFRLPSSVLERHVSVIDTAALFAAAIDAVHRDASLLPLTSPEASS